MVRERGRNGCYVFYYRVWVAAMYGLGVKRRKGTLKAFGMLCTLLLVDVKRANLESGSIFLLIS